MFIFNMLARTPCPIAGGWRPIGGEIDGFSQSMQESVCNAGHCLKGQDFGPSRLNGPRIDRPPPPDQPAINHRPLSQTDWISLAHRFPAWPFCRGTVKWGACADLHSQINRIGCKSGNTDGTARIGECVIQTRELIGVTPKQSA